MGQPKHSLVRVSVLGWCWHRFRMQSTITEGEQGLATRGLSFWAVGRARRVCG